MKVLNVLTRREELAVRVEQSSIHYPNRLVHHQQSETWIIGLCLSIKTGLIFHSVSPPLDVIQSSLSIRPLYICVCVCACECGCIWLSDKHTHTHTKLFGLFVSQSSHKL